MQNLLLLRLRMKLSSKLGIYIALTLLMYLSVYKFFDKEDYISTKRDILKFDKDIFDKRMSKLTVNEYFNYLWLEKNNNILENNMNDLNKGKKGNLINIKKPYTICINSNCFRLIAILKKNNIAYAAFYSKQFPKDHIKLFNESTQLYNNLIIKKVFDDSVVFSEYNTTQKWKIFLFDVNASKYKPKDSNETLL